MDVQFLKSFKPDGDALLRRISTHIDDAMLEHIASVDPVGSDSRRAGFINALRNIRDGGPLKRRSDFASWDEFYAQDTTELLETSRYTEPDVDRGHRWEWHGTRGHWPRAFSCAALLRSYGDNEVRSCTTDYFNYAMMQLVESVRRLDVGIEPEAMAALAWFIMRLSDDERSGIDSHPDQVLFAGIGILSLAANSKNMISNDTIIELTDWLIAKEQETFDGQGRTVSDFPNHWHFRTTIWDIQREKWIAIGAELAAFKVTGPCGDAVRAIGQRLSGQTLMS